MKKLIIAFGLALSFTTPAFAFSQAECEAKAVSKDGKYALNGNVVQTAALAEKISLIKNQVMQNNEANINTLRVVISADAKASHQAVMQVLEIASQAGLNNIVFATQDTQATPKKR